MRICHISDLHADLTALRQHGKRFSKEGSELLILTGDMFPNFPLLRVAHGRGKERKVEDVTMSELYSRPWSDPAHVVGRFVDRPREVQMQRDWMRQNPFRKTMGISEKVPVVCVRGNHDFTDLSEWIGGDVWEVTEDSSRYVIINGIKIGGLRGIREMIGEWSDELNEDVFQERVRALPKDLHILLSHTPPQGILDGYESHHFGTPSIVNYINRRTMAENADKILHCFGHVHEMGGHVLDEGGVIFSNAATTINFINFP
jgi:Icc-related predicted phosphoesterase